MFLQLPRCYAKWFLGWISSENDKITNDGGRKGTNDGLEDGVIDVRLKVTYTPNICVI